MPLTVALTLHLPDVEEREAIDLSKFDCPRFVMERPRDYEEVPLDYFPAYSDVEFSPFEDSDETDYKMGLDLINCKLLLSYVPIFPLFSRRFPALFAYIQCINSL